MARGHLTRSPSGHLTRQAGRSPDSPSGSTFTLADGLADFLVSGRARGRNRVVPAGADERAAYDVLTTPTELQTRAFALIGVTPARM